MRGSFYLKNPLKIPSHSEAGLLFLDQAGPAITQILQAQENVKSFGQKPTGVLKLNMPGVFYPYYLAPYIDSFLKKYPKVTVDIHSDDQADDIFELGFDAGVRPDDILAKDLIAFKLFGPIQFIAVAAPEYLTERGTPKHLLNHNCIRHKFGSGSVYKRWEFAENEKEFSVHVGGNLILNDSNSIRHACLNGAGVTYTELENVKQDIEVGKLKWFLKSFLVESTGYYLYYPHKTHISPTLRAFIEHFREVRKSRLI